MLTTLTLLTSRLVVSPRPKHVNSDIHLLGKNQMQMKLVLL